MIDEIESLLGQYAAWLKDQTTLHQINDWVEITTPYLDRHNDYLQIYAKRTNGGYLLTDDGYVLQDLELSGCKLDTPRRQTLLQMTLRGFGVQLRQGALEVYATATDFALHKHNLLQAMLAVNDLFYLAMPMVANLFYEDVTVWLDLHEVRYTPGVKFTGKSGYDHYFDFVIPKSRHQPERVIQVLNRPSRDTAQALAFAWLDTREVRPLDARAYAFLNDSEHAVAPGTIEALKNYDVSPILWSKREEVREELVT